MISNLAPLYIVESRFDAGHRQNPVPCPSVVRGYRVIAERREVPHWTCGVSPEMMSVAAPAPSLSPERRLHSRQISTGPLRHRAGPGSADSLSAIGGFPRLNLCATMTSCRNVGIIAAVIAPRCSAVPGVRSSRAAWHQPLPGQAQHDTRRTASCYRRKAAEGLRLFDAASIAGRNRDFPGGESFRREIDEGSV
jgi:hypothetical protein